jgi:hypothetical protein
LDEFLAVESNMDQFDDLILELQILSDNALFLTRLLEERLILINVNEDAITFADQINEIKLYHKDAKAGGVPDELNYDMVQSIVGAGLNRFRIEGTEDY